MKNNLHSDLVRVKKIGVLINMVKKVKDKAAG
jgi:hypothetical protein